MKLIDKTSYKVNFKFNLISNFNLFPNGKTIIVNCNAYKEDKATIFVLNCFFDKEKFSIQTGTYPHEGNTIEQLIFRCLVNICERIKQDKLEPFGESRDVKSWKGALIRANSCDVCEYDFIIFSDYV